MPPVPPVPHRAIYKHNKSYLNRYAILWRKTKFRLQNEFCAVLFSYSRVRVASLLDWSYMLSIAQSTYGLLWPTFIVQWFFPICVFLTAHIIHLFFFYCIHAKWFHWESARGCRIQFKFSLFMKLHRRYQTFRRGRLRYCRNQNESLLWHVNERWRENIAWK